MEVKMERSSFFNSVNGDRRYDATDWAAYFASFIGNGVFGSPADCLKAVPEGGMRVALLPGSAWINGYYYVNTARLPLALDMADGVLKRIDRVVIQWNLADRQIIALIKKGSAAVTPVAPVLQRDASVYEICVADILVSAGATSIMETDISDKRQDHQLCGVVASVVSEEHSHDLNMLEGPLNIEKGGTGAATAAAARNALGLGNTSGALPIANGGTGQTSASAARNALGAAGLATATGDANGLMSAEDKEKLNGIATSANNYVHPNSGVIAGNYRQMTVNAQGHITGASNPTWSLSQGGTGATSDENARKNLMEKAGIANDKGNWNLNGVVLQMNSPTTALTGAPSSYGIILSASVGTEVHQFWMTQAGGAIYHRGGNANGWAATTWTKLFDDTMVVPIANGGTGAASVEAARNALGLGNTSGALPIANGGTGATTATAARNALGLGNTTGAVPVANGGTGATTVAGARNALGLGDTSGAVPIANGGTGQTTAAAARNALGLGNTTGAVPVANGGTGATTVEAARNALGLGNTAGAVPIANGGTGQTTVAAARNALGLGNTAGAVPIGNGGTGQTSAKGAMNALGIFYAASLPASGTDGQVCLVPV